MAHYFVRRGDKVFGPVTGEQVVGLAKSGKVRATDEIATDKNGPWRPTTALTTLRAVFGPSSVDPLGPVAADPFDIGPPSKERKPPFEMPEQKTLIIAGTVLGVLLISGLGAMFFFGGDDDDAAVAVVEKTKQTSRASVPLGKRFKNYMLVKTMYVPGGEGEGIPRYIVWICFGIIGTFVIMGVVLLYAWCSWATRGLNNTSGKFPNRPIDTQSWASFERDAFVREPRSPLSTAARPTGRDRTA